MAAKAAKKPKQKVSKEVTIDDFDGEIASFSTSAKIRFLNGKGFTTKQISTHLNIRYQHARNVLVTPLKRQIKAEREEARRKQLEELSNG